MPPDTKVGPWTPNWWSFPITTTFGGPTAGDPLRPHLGVDFAAPLGTPVQAAGVGTVSKVFSDQMGGHQVQVKYAQGGTGWFAHLNDILVAEGDKVNPASILGHSGQSGNSTGPHLHFQLLNQGGQSVDPLGAGVFSKLVSQNGSFPFADAGGGACPTGWHRGTPPTGFSFCVPDGLMFGGGDPAKNTEDLRKAITPDISGVTNPLDAAKAALDAAAKAGNIAGVLGGIWDSISKSSNIWRVAFIVLGIGAVFVGGRMYLHNESVPVMREGASG